MPQRDGLLTAPPRQGIKRNSVASANGSSSVDSSAGAGAPRGTDLVMALQVLDEQTMIQACSLLLSERDYQDDVVNEESDYSKLLDLFMKCNDAARVVTEQQRFGAHQNKNSRVVSAPPPSSAAIKPSSRPAAAAPRSLKAQGQFNSMNPPRRIPSLQMPRTGTGMMSAPTRMKVAATGAAAAAATTISASQRPTLKRTPSDSSLASNHSVSSNRSVGSKKVRLGTNTSANPDTTSTGAAPPPEALYFLQALNNQQSNKQEEEDAASSSLTEEKNALPLRAANTASSPSPPLNRKHSPRKRP